MKCALHLDRDTRASPSTLAKLKTDESRNSSARCDESRIPQQAINHLFHIPSGVSSVASHIRSTACSTYIITYSVQHTHAAYHKRHAAHDIQHNTHKMQCATCNVQCTPYIYNTATNIQHARHSTPHVTVNMHKQHTTYNLCLRRIYDTRYNMQDTRHKTQHTTQKATQLTPGAIHTIRTLTLDRSFRMHSNPAYQLYARQPSCSSDL